MGQHLAPVDLRQASFYLIDEPLVVVYETLDGFEGKRLRVATLFGCEVRKLVLHSGG